MALFLFIILFLAFFLAGETLASLWRPSYSHILERWVFHTLLGLIAVALLTTGLAFAGAIYPATGWILLAIIFLLAAVRSRRELASILPQLKPSMGNVLGTDRGFQGFCILALTLLAGLALMLALAPPVKTDALVYHLAIPRAYFEHHGIVNLPNSMYSFFPLLFDMVFLFAMTFGVESLPALCGLGMTFLLLAGLAVYFRQYLSPRLTWFVPVLFFSTPTFFEISASAYIDVALAGFIFFAFYSWDRWLETRRTFWFYYLAVCAGAAFATKLTGLITLPLGILGIALAGRKDPRPGRVLKQMLVFSGIALLFVAPWWMRNFQFSGNPFLPLLMPVLGGEDRVNWDPQRMAMFDHYVRMFGMGRGPLDLLMLPYNLTFKAEPHSLKFDGQIGILFFMLIPALITGIWKYRSPRVLALSVSGALLILFWFVYFQYARFLAPAFTALTVLSVFGLERITRADPGSSGGNRWMGPIIFGVLACGVVYNLGLIWEMWNKKAPHSFLTGRETRAQYLARNVPPYPMYQAMNNLPAESRIFLVYMRNLGYLAERPFYSDSIFEAHTLQTLLQQDDSVEGLRRQLKDKGFTHLMFDRAFVFGQGGALPPHGQAALEAFLKQRGKRVKQMDSFFLYELVLD